MTGGPDEARFSALVERHEQRVYACAYRILADREEALDVLQESWLALHQRLGAVADEWAGAWLARVATNRALDRWRRRRPAAGRAVEPAVDDAPGLDDQTREHVLGALDRLSARQREVLVLRIVEEQRFPAIAAGLGISEGAAKSHFKRGLAALRTILAPLEREAEDDP